MRVSIKKRNDYSNLDGHLTVILAHKSAHMKNNGQFVSTLYPDYNIYKNASICLNLIMILCIDPIYSMH